MESRECQPPDPRGNRCGPRRGRRLWVVLGILAVCLAIRGRLIATSDLIARDGTEYVKYSQELSADPVEAAKRNRFHPGYPLAVLYAHRFLTYLGAPHDITTWDLAGRLVSLAASLVATLGLLLFATRVLNWPAACIATLLFSVTRKWVSLGADVLTEAMAVAFLIWAMAFALMAAAQLRRSRARALVPAACVGLCAAASYLVRPEGLIVLPAVVSLWVTNMVAKRAPWRLSLAVILISLGTAATCAAPYVMMIGGLSKNLNILRLLPPATPLSAHGAATGTAWALAGTAAGFDSGLHKVFDQFVVAQHPILTVLAVVCLATWVGTKALKGRLPETVRIFPSKDGAILMLAMVALTVPMLMRHWAETRELSHRYLIPLAMVTVPLAGAGVLILRQRWLILSARLRWRREWASAAFCLGGAGLVVAMSVHALRPLHVGKDNHRQAARFLQGLVGPSDRVVTNEVWILHYAQVKGTHISPWFYVNERSMLHLLRWHYDRPTFVVFCERAKPNRLDTRTRPTDARFTHIRDFPSSVPGRGATVRIYRLSRQGWDRKPPRR